MKKTSRIGSAPSNPRRWQRNGLAAASLMALASIAMGQSADMSVTYATTGTGLSTFSPSGSVLSWSFSNALGQIQSATSAVTNAPSSLTMGVNLSGSGSSAASITRQVIQTLTRVNVLTPSAVSGRTVDLSLINSGDTNIAYALQLSSGGSTGSSPTYTLTSQTVSATTGTPTGAAVVELAQSGFSSSLRALDNNLISSAAVANTSQLVIAGPVSGTYSSSQTGAATAVYASTGAGSSAVKASAAVDALQGAFNVDGLASITNGEVRMVVAKSSGDLSNALSVSGNTVEASTGANNSTNLFQATSTSGAYTGTALVSNVQAASRSASNTSAFLSTIEDSSIVANIKEADGANITKLTSALSQNSNSIVSSVAVNNSGARASNGTLSSAGNVVQFDSGASVTGSSSVAATAVTAGTTTLVADVGILSAQVANNLSLTATAQAGSGGALQINAQADQIGAGGSITQDGNLITSRAAPNVAGNLVSIGQTAQSTSLTGSIGAANVQQVDGNTTVKALMTAGEVVMEVGLASVTNNGAATSSNNTVSALADANLAATSVVASAANMAVSNSVPTGASTYKGVTIGLTSSATTPSSLKSNVGVSNLNQQVSDNTKVDAILTSSNVQLSSSASSSMIPVSAFNGTLTGNALTAAASANTASNLTSLSGTSAPSLTASVGNSQVTLIDTNKTIAATAGSTASVTSLLDVSLLTGDATSSNLAVTSNTINSSAFANKASNGLSTALSTQMTGKGTDAPNLNVVTNGSSAGLDVTALGDLTLANAQFTDSLTGGVKISATTVGTVQLGALIVSGAGSSMNLSSNRVASAAGFNQATNTATLNAADASGVSAGVLSNQIASDAWADVSTTGASVSLAASSLSATTAVVNQNTVTSAANGNTAANTLSSTSNTLSGRTITEAAGLTSGASTTVSAVADVGLLNNQTLTNNKLNAGTTSNNSSEAVNVTISSSGVPGALAAATNLTVNRNTVSASAEGNTATNRIELTSNTTSTASSALVSRQVITNSSATTFGANVNDQVLVSTGAVGTASNIQLDANKIQTSALGNYAINSQLLSGGVLTRSSPTTLSISSTDGTVAADNALVNLQSATNNLVDADTRGLVTLTTGALSGSSTLALTNNQLNATAQLNYADSRQTLNYSSSLAGATQGILSKQTATTSSATADLAAASGGSPASKQAISIASVSSGTAQLNQNTADVAAGLNTSFNRISLGVNNLTTPNSAINNLQTISNTTETVAASLADQVNLDVSGTTATGVLNVLSNTTRAQSLGNMAMNTMDLQGSQVSSTVTAGAGGLNSATGASSTAQQGLINTQTATGSAFTALNNSTVSLTGGGATSLNSRLALNSNTVTSTVQVNSATNTQSAALSSGSTTTSMGIASSQTALTTATATATTTTVQKVDLASSLGDSNIEVNGNLASANATVNTVANSITLGGLTSGAGTLITGNGLTTSWAATTGTPTVTSTADVGIANYQSSADKTPSSVLTADIGIESGAITGATATSQLSLSNNTASSVAQANSASNRVVLNATTMTAMTAGVANAQKATTDVTATIANGVANGGVLRMDLGAVSAANLLVSGNQLLAVASMNDASNQLAVSGTTLIGKGTDVTSLPTVQATTLGNMDFGLLNVQTGTNITADNGATANVHEGGVNVSINPGKSVIYSTSLGNGTNMTLRDNLLSAQGMVNNASNLLSLTATGDLKASAAVKNVQTANSDVFATLGGVSGTPATFGMETDGIAAGATGNFTMDNNVFRAQAGANNATNVLNASGGTSIATSGSGTTTPYNFAILNYQDAALGTTISAKVQYLNLGSDVSVTGANTGNVNVTMTGNQVVALAYGNLVSNTIGIKTLGQGMETTGTTVNSVQTSKATLTASVTGVNMSVTNSGGVGGSVAMSGNSITSQVVANQASVGMVAR
ncbi:MAG: hypothetical protein RIQ97_2428 [Pseudomonadota bacterium]|jgi:hypothetical protein